MMVKFSHILSLTFLLCISQHLAAQISGKVYRDYNNNGVQGIIPTNTEPGAAGIIVNFYNSADVLMASFTTNGTGDYSVPASGTAYNGTIGSNTGFIPSGTATRVEFLIPNNNIVGTANYLTVPSFSGTGNETAIQFVTAGASAINVNFAINKPADYVDTNPLVGYAIMVQGNQITGPNKDKAVLFHMTYSQGNVAGTDSVGKTMYATAKTLGSTFGLAHQRSSRSIFVSSFMKRYAGFGPGGTGAIYKVSTNNNYITSFLDLNTLYGAGTAGIDPHPTNNNINSWDKDSASWDYVGKISLGDIDISEDEQTLWAISLTDRKLYKIPLGSATNPVAPTAAQITKYPSSGNLTGLSGLVGTNLSADIRPFGLGVRNGLVYVGLVHSAQTSGLTTELRAFVYSFNPSTEVFTKVLDFPLNYARGRVVSSSGGAFVSANWQPWKTNFTVSAPIYSSEFGVPQPILSDITFVDNNMVLGFKDRYGDQMGFQVLSPTGDNNGGAFYSGDTGGEILFASPNGTGGWTIESNSASNPTGSFGPTAGAGNAQGPGGGEFLLADKFPVSQTLYTGYPYIIHDEVALGGVAQIPGSNEIVTTIFDPVDDINTAFDGGIAWYNMTNGTRKRAFWTYDGGAQADPFFGKANGMGDIEILSTPAPNEIGNRVWNDVDMDGVQDAGEVGIGNVGIELYADFDNNGVPDGGVLATTTTSTTGVIGTWYFNKANVIDGDPITAGNQAGLKPSSNYLVRIAATSWSGGVGISALDGFNLTVDNTPAGKGDDDQIDSDATLISNIPQISTPVSVAGCANHTFDFGFKAIGSVGNYVWIDLNGNGLQDEGASNGVNGVTVELWSPGTNGVIGGGDDYIVSTTITANNGSGQPGYYNFIVEYSGSYFVKFPINNSAYTLTTQTATAATDGNSDANITTGYTSIFSINVTGTGTAKNNPTLDAGYKCLTGNCLPLGTRKVN